MMFCYWKTIFCLCFICFAMISFFIPMEVEAEESDHIPNVEQEKEEDEIINNPDPGEGNTLIEQDYSKSLSADQREKIYRRLELRHLVGQISWYIKTHQRIRVAPLLENLIKRHPHSPEVDYFRAVEYYRVKKNARALVSLTKALQKHPDFARAWNFRGILLSQSDRDGQALGCFKRAMLLNPYHPDYVYNFAFSFYKQKQYKEAMKAIKKSIYLKPNYSRSFYLAGLVHRELGELSRAFFSYVLAEEFGQDGSDFYIDFLEIALEVDDDKAILRLSQILEKKTRKNPSILRILVEAARRLGDYKKALFFLRKVVTGSDVVWEDYQNYVYVLEKNEISAVRYISRFRLEKTKKLKLKKYARELSKQIKRQKLLKSQDPILRSMK